MTLPIRGAHSDVTQAHTRASRRQDNQRAVRGCLSWAAQGPQDPGVRGGTAAAGGLRSGLGTPDLSFLNGLRTRFEEVDLVSRTIESGVALRPEQNANH
jgi:hypothetical protein